MMDFNCILFRGEKYFMIKVIFVCCCFRRFSLFRHELSVDYQSGVYGNSGNDLRVFKGLDFDQTIHEAL